jgi:hypothetical protein
MDDKQIDFLMYIVGVVGLLILLGGVFSLYDFKYGLIVAIILWIIAGAVQRYPR